MSDFKAKMHQNPKFGSGSAPDPAGGACSAPLNPSLDLRGLLLRGGERSGGEGTGGEGTGGEGSVVESQKSLK